MGSMLYITIKGLFLELIEIGIKTVKNIKILTSTFYISHVVYIYFIHIISVR